MEHIGKEHENRVSLYISEQRGFIEILDKHGKSYISDWNFEFNKPLHIRMEISNDADHGFFLLTINDSEIELRQKSQGLDVEPDFYSFVLGADLSMQNGAKFKMISQQLVNGTLELTDRIEYYFYYKRTISESQRCVEFDGTKCLRRRLGDGALIQEIKEQRPVLSGSFTEYFKIDYAALK